MVELVEENVVDLEHYQIQQYCRTYVRVHSFSAKYRNLLKLAAYENSITYEDVLDVIAVELRDVLIARLPYLGGKGDKTTGSAFAVALDIYLMR